MHPLATFLPTFVIISTLLPGLHVIGQGTSVSSVRSDSVSGENVTSPPIVGSSANHSVNGSCDCYDNKCFCGEDAKKLKACLKSKNPNYPFLESLEDYLHKGDCPRYISDDIKGPVPPHPCFPTSTLTFDPNSEKIYNDCVTSTKVTANTSSAQSSGSLPILLFVFLSGIFGFGST